MTPRLKTLSLAVTAAAVTAVIGVGGLTQTASASPAPLDATGVAMTGDQTGGHLTIVPITQDEYANAPENVEGHCSTEVGVTICDKVSFDNTWLGQARWSAVAAVGHADDLYVDETAKTVEGTKLWSSGHASGLGPWVRITWVSPRHPGDTSGIMIPGEANLQFLTNIAIPGSLGPTSYCAGPELDYEYQITCGTWVPNNW